MNDQELNIALAKTVGVWKEGRSHWDVANDTMNPNAAKKALGLEYPTKDDQ